MGKARDPSPNYSASISDYSSRSATPTPTANQTLARGEISIAISASSSHGSNTSELSWDDEDALKEKNITQAMRKFSGHQALQTAMYSSMGLRRKPGRSAIPGKMISVNTDGGESDSDQFDIRTVEVPLRKTVKDFVNAVDSKPEVKPLSAADFRELIQPLSEKRQEYHKIRNQIHNKAKKAETHMMLKRWKKLKSFVRHVLEILTPFRTTLMWIDSQYGSDVYCYFTFIIWIISFNLVSFAVTFCFGLVPSIFFHDSNNGSAAFTTVYTRYKASDLLTGEGSLSCSAFHYGFYLSDKSPFLTGLNSSYDRSVAYLLAIAAFYLIQLVAITYSLTKSYGQLMSVTMMGGKQHYCDTLFFLWEHSSHARDQIDLQKIQLMTKLREMLAVNRRLDQFTKAVYLKRLVINFGIFGLVAAICAGLWYTFASLSNHEAAEYELEKKLAPIIFITVANFFLPFLFSYVTKSEKSASYETELMLSLIKGMALNLGSLGVLFFYSILEESGQKISDSLLSQRANNCDLQRDGCWETHLSTKFYQLAIMNMIFDWLFFILGASLVFIQVCIHPDKRWQLTFRADLLMQRALYLLVLTWLGMYYSPLICVLALISIALSFVRDILIIRFTRIYKSAPLGSGNESTQVAYSSALLLCFIVCAAIVAFAVTLMLPSKDCGPFRTMCPDPDLIVAAITRWKADTPTLYELLQLTLMPSVLLWFILFLIVFIYYFNMKATALDELLPVLQNHLAMEGRDVTHYYLHLLRLEEKKKRKLKKISTPQRVN